MTLVVASMAVFITPMVGQGVVRGFVRADSTGLPIAGAQVTRGETTATADRNGHYLLTLPTGAHEVGVRAIGYRPLGTSVRLAPGDTVSLDFQLTRSAVELPELKTIVAAAPAVAGKMEGFEQRRRIGLGKYLGRAELAGQQAIGLTNVLRTMGGVRMLPRPRGCGGGYSAGTMRGGSLGGGIPLHCITSANVLFGPGCYFAVFVDGMPIWTYSSPEPPNMDDYPVEQLEAVEVYVGASQLPAEFTTMGASCGAILLWTRVGGKE